MLEQGYVRVVKEEGCESIELPLEIDSSLLLSTLQSAFPKACGMKYRTENNSLRGVRLSSGRFYPPEGIWPGTNFICVMSKEKRKSEDSSGNPTKKRAAVSDLIILGLAWRTTEDQVRRYFETFGEVTMTVVKMDQVTRLSKGFGFVRFRDPVVQTKVISQRHFIDGRWCDVKIPNNYQDVTQDCKIFVGQLTSDTSAVELREYFSSFGEVADIFIPQPFRMFAFVTFKSPTDAKSVCDMKNHSINGIPINVSEAMPLTKNPPKPDKAIRFGHTACVQNANHDVVLPLLNNPMFNWNTCPTNSFPYIWNGTSIIPNSFIPG